MRHRGPINNITRAETEHKPKQKTNVNVNKVLDNPEVHAVALRAVHVY